MKTISKKSLEVVNMKHISILLLLFFFCAEAFAEESVSRSYELIGINTLSDQAMVRSISGDDYFFGIEDGKLVSRRKLRDEDFFEDFFPDFNYHNFSNFKYVEETHFSNDRDMLFFVATEDGVESINVLSFDNDSILIYRDDLKIDNLTGDINFFKIIHDQKDDVRLIYNSEDSLYSRFFRNNFIIQVYDDPVSLGIRGNVYKFNQSIDYVDSSPIIYNTLIVKDGDSYNLWAMLLHGDTVERSFIKTLSKAEADSFSMVIYGKTIQLTYRNGSNDLYIKLNFDDMTFVEQSVPIGSAEIGNYLLQEDDYIIGESSLTFENDVFNYLGTTLSVENLTQWFILGRELFLFTTNNGCSVIKKYYVSEKSLVQQQELSIRVFIDKISKIKIKNEILEFNNFSIYYDSSSGYLYQSDIPIKSFRDYVLVKDNSTLKLVLGDDYEK